MLKHRKKQKNIQIMSNLWSDECTRQHSSHTVHHNQVTGKRSDERNTIKESTILLTRRIFGITQRPGIVSRLIEQSECKNSHRLTTTKRIHEENMGIASRQESVNDHYSNSTHNLSSSKTNNAVCGNSRFGSIQMGSQNKDDATSRSGHGTKGVKIFGAVGYEWSEERPTGPRNLTLEYTKIQNGRLLDIVVLKESFQDKFFIFGVDVDSGQKYYLQRTSDEVSSLLEENMMVGSMDKEEVWANLLNKVDLIPVNKFVSTPNWINSTYMDEQWRCSGSSNSSNRTQYDGRDDQPTDFATRIRETTCTGQEDICILDEYFDSHTSLEPLEKKLTNGTSTSCDPPKNRDVNDDTNSKRIYSNHHAHEDANTNIQNGKMCTSSPQLYQSSHICTSGVTGEQPSEYPNTTKGSEVEDQETTREAVMQIVFTLIKCAIENTAISVVKSTQQSTLNSQKETTVQDLQIKHPLPKPPNPYTCTRIFVSPRSNRIRYTQIGRNDPAIPGISIYTDEAKRSRCTIIKPPADVSSKTQIFKRFSVVRQLSERKKKIPRRPNEVTPSSCRRPTHRQPKNGVRSKQHM